VPVSELNSPGVDMSPWISRDGLEIYFASDRTAPYWLQYHIYHATRASVHDQFSSLVLVPEINNPPRQFFPYLSEDGLTMYFDSTKWDPESDASIWEITRPSLTAPWDSTTQRLVPVIYHPGMAEWNESQVVTSGNLHMVFMRRIPSTQWDIYVSTRTSTLVNWGEPQPLSDVNTEAIEMHPFITNDGLMIFFGSNRPGSLGDEDIYVAVRDSKDQPFGPTVNLVEINSPGIDRRAIYHEATKTLYFYSDRDGNLDIYSAQFTTAPITLSHPTLHWSTYLGGGGTEYMSEIVASRGGGVYAAMNTDSWDFPIAQLAARANFDVVVMRLGDRGTPAGLRVLSGSGVDACHNMAEGPDGSLLLTGYTTSSNFPTSAAYDATYNGGTGPYGDAFVTKLRPDGSIVWSTFLGGSSEDYGWDIQADAGGNVYVSGMTSSADFPATSQSGPRGDLDAFVAKFTAAGQSVWSHIFSGSNAELGRGIHVDDAGHVYFCGITVSPDFVAQGGFDTTYGGAPCDGFLVKLDAATGALLWSSFFGGSEADTLSDVLADTSGTLYATGFLGSEDLATSTSYYHTTGTISLCLIKFNPQGALLGTARFGGSAGSGDNATAFVFDPARSEIVVTGDTHTLGLPPALTNSTYFGGGEYDAYLARFDTDLQPRGFYYVGGVARDEGLSVAVDTSGSLYAAGVTVSPNLGLRGYDDTFNGGVWDGFVAKFAYYPAPPVGALIRTDPSGLRVSVPQYNGPVTASLVISNGGTGTLEYSFQATPDFITMDAPGGQVTNGQRLHTVYFNPGQRTPGLYRGTISVEGTAANSPVIVPVEMTVVVQPPSPPNLVVVSADFAPAAPEQVYPGAPITISALVANQSSNAAGPFWVEVFGSRMGGLTLDRFLARSLILPGGLGPNMAYSWVTNAPLDSLPDGPYTVVYAVDRPGQVAESNERDNRAVVAAKRILVIRPQTQIDLAVTSFSLNPNPATSGQDVAFSGAVANNGAAPSGPFWIEFWGSWDWPYPSLDFFLCDSIPVGNLDPGQTVDLSLYPRRLYRVPAGVFQVGCFVDRDDAINETDETNNSLFYDGQVFNRLALTGPARPTPASGPDIAVVSARLDSPTAGSVEPETTMTLTVEIANLGDANTGPFWLEYFGSRDGGVTLSAFLGDSDRVANLAPGRRVAFTTAKPLYSIADGPYSIVVAADRPGSVTETDETNNRKVIAGARLLVIRPPTAADLTVSGFNIPYWYSTISGSVRNMGAEDSGPFWIEFWATLGDPDYPAPQYFVADSIWQPNLAPGQSLNLSSYRRTLTDTVYGLPQAYICIIDRPDEVNERDETNNFSILRRPNGWR
jgi:hypothetical protein